VVRIYVGLPLQLVSFSEPRPLRGLRTNQSPIDPFRIYSIHKRYENRFVSKFRDEIIGLSFLWLFWIVGTGIATVSFASRPAIHAKYTTVQSFWGNLGFCQKINACRVLSALVGFCWLSWLTLTAILAVSLLFSIANTALLEPMHGRWDPRQTHYA
jgi:hypothetical protein